MHFATKTNMMSRVIVYFYLFCFFVVVGLIFFLFLLFLGRHHFVCCFYSGSQEAHKISGNEVAAVWLVDY